MKCVSYTRTMPWKNHTGELTIADQNQRVLQNTWLNIKSSIYRKSILTVRVQKTRVRHLTK